jgi:hypothetical protein
LGSTSLQLPDTFESRVSCRSAGKWWHHNAVDTSDLIDCLVPHETHKSFGARAAAFRAWLGAEAGRSGAANVAVISHGGLLTTAFGGPEYGNVEFRLYDLLPDGSYTRVAPVSDSETPKILREETRPGDRERGDSDEVTFYIVRFGDAGPELPRRYSDFLSLKRALKVAGRERHKALFPSKAHGAMMGIAGAELDGLVETRSAKLEEWLAAVVHQHSIHDETIAAWAAVRWDGGDTPTSAAGDDDEGLSPEPEPEPEMMQPPTIGIGLEEGTFEGISVSILGTVKRSEQTAGGAGGGAVGGGGNTHTYYILSVTSVDESGVASAQQGGGNIERRYSDFVSAVQCSATQCSAVPRSVPRNKTYITMNSCTCFLLLAVQF